MAVIDKQVPKKVNPDGADAAPPPGPPLLPSLFLAGATLLLAVNTPIQLSFQPQPGLTLALALAGGAVLAWGTYRRRLPILLLGVAGLLGVMLLCLGTQPAVLGISPATFWPVRGAVIVLVAEVWAFLMDPPAWVRRALLAVAATTALLLLVAGGPAMAAQWLGGKPDPALNFIPNWLAVDSRGTLYATSASGNEIVLFDPSGSVSGTIWPGRAPAPGTPGPGIVPTGYEAAIGLVNPNTLPTTTPAAGPTDPDLTGNFAFCGLTVDARDNLYAVDWSSPASRGLLRFDSRGNLTARWPLPLHFTPAHGCLAADAHFIYLASGDGRIFVLDLDGALQHTLQVPYQPLGIAGDGAGQVTVLGRTFLNRLTLAGGPVMTTTLPPPATVLQTPYLTLLITPRGETLVADQGRSAVLVIDPQTGAIRRMIGAPGSRPGQFASPGGLAQDPAGRLYVADRQHRVIQRFSPDGKLDAVWWALELGEDARDRIGK